MGWNGHGKRLDISIINLRGVFGQCGAVERKNLTCSLTQAHFVSSIQSRKISTKLAKQALTISKHCLPNERVKCRLRMPSSVSKRACKVRVFESQDNIQKNRRRKKKMMNMKKEIEEGMKLIWKKVEPKDLKPGDHIYAYKRYGSYSHHGIYVGDSYVIHFNRTESKEAIFPNSRVEAETVPACPECDYQENTGRGVIKMCLNCFRRGQKKLHSIHRFMYGALQLGFLLKNSGTCSTLSCTRSPEQVVEAANELLRNGFGKYHLTGNNCEHFATYCQTGVRASVQTAFYDAWLMKYRELKNRS
ncbi:hypothetical protein BT93_L1725 [Corymbia citriodora subsp. variegata]|uniref:LRAT domain-containing protein n=1 Tax=Corymbia citriodora subsp. variegata TaxID=360336 RepID=A0A8T0CLZ7_CORYI|nr:hypothetical protein BT93_L1725 [Corymbia citriodora subsp. variegata]